MYIHCGDSTDYRQSRFFRLCLLFLNAEWSTLIFTFLLFEASYVIISIALKLSISLH